MEPTPTKISEPRYAVITGGGAGIGSTTCQRLASRGWTIAVVDSRAAAAQATADLLPADTAPVAVQADVAEHEDWLRLENTLRERWPRIDLLINNAGVLAAGELTSTPAETLELMLTVNLQGVFFGCRTLGPWLIESSRDTPREKNQWIPRSGIVNVASIFGCVSPPGFAAYSATKAGVIAFSEALRGELAPIGLNVTVVVPGVVRTRLLRDADYGSDAYRKAAEEYLERAELEPYDVAGEMLSAAAAGKLYAVVGKRARWYWRLKRWLPTTTISKVAARTQEVLRRHTTDS